MITNNNPKTVLVDVDIERESHYIFYSREVSGSDFIVIPKKTDYQIFEITETPDSYIITATTKDAQINELK